MAGEKGKIVKTKNGRYARVLANGKWRFISAAEAGHKKAEPKKAAPKKRKSKKAKKQAEEEEVPEE